MSGTKSSSKRGFRPFCSRHLGLPARDGSPTLGSQSPGTPVGPVPIRPGEWAPLGQGRGPEEGTSEHVPRGDSSHTVVGLLPGSPLPERPYSVVPNHPRPRPLLIGILALVLVALTAGLVSAIVPEPNLKATGSAPSSAPAASASGAASGSPSAVAPTTSKAAATTAKAAAAAPAAPSSAAPSPSASAAAQAPAPAAAPAGSAYDATAVDATTGLSNAQVTGAPPAAGLAAAALRVVNVSSSAALTQAINSAKPGDRITLASGRYTGPFTITTAGTAAHPVVVVPASGAKVTLGASLRYPTCGATGPDGNRTVQFAKGASHWVLQGLTIDGGVIMSSQGADNTYRWFEQLISSHNWQARRAVPGAGSRNAASAREAVSYLQSKLGTTLRPIDDIQLIGNVITGKGVFGRMTRYGVLSGNTITAIKCGTGPGVWLANFSNGWVINRNDVSQVAHSTAIHFMQEGIRLGNASNYNVVSNNVVHDLAVGGRAITTDQDASWNLFSGNTTRNTDIGFNEQMSGWGNQWVRNTASAAATAGFSIRMEDLRLPKPSMDTSSMQGQFSCNTYNGSGRALQIGGIGRGTFTGNAFASVFLGKGPSSYWGAQGNTWNGSSAKPASQPALSRSGC